MKRNNHVVILHQKVKPNTHGYYALKVKPKGPDTRCNIARNVAGLEASSTSATFHATIAPCVHRIAHNVARNVASCVRSLMVIVR